MGLIASWGNFIILLIIVLAGLFIFKTLGDIFKVHLKNNKKSKDRVNRFFDFIYELPSPIKKTFKVIGTVLYIAICIMIIAYSSEG